MQNIYLIFFGFLQLHSITQNFDTSQAEISHFYFLTF